ncbi:MAG: L,D-transpeptidase family protein [Candidatus Sumerlaeota bacterium]|nr:L,D-transpeptidase family protein [Candidatus Sumerlaeota bacterium]
MSFRSFFLTFFVILLLAGVAGGGAYLYMQRRQGSVSQELEKAALLAKQGEYEKALEIVEKLPAQAKGSTLVPNVEIARIEILVKLGRDADAAKYSEEFIQRFASSPMAALPRAVLGRAALARGEKDKARQYFETALKDAKDDPQGPAAVRATLGLANIMAADGVLIGAKKQIEALMKLPLEPQIKDEVENELGSVNIKLLYGRETSDKDIVHEMQSGDSIGDLSKKYNVPMTVLIKKNSILDPRKMGLGRRIIIPIHEFSIEVDRFSNTLTVKDKGELFKKYRVRTGGDNYMTPEGDFEIKSKKENPTWSDPKTAIRYPGGDPHNELGTRWMSFMGARLGIHGTIHPDSIGLYSSNGCVGMAKEDVEELYDYIPSKTPLKIFGKQNPLIKKRSTEYLKRSAPAPLQAVGDETEGGGEGVGGRDEKTTGALKTAPGETGKSSENPLWKPRTTKPEPTPKKTSPTPKKTEAKSDKKK